MVTYEGFYGGAGSVLEGDYGNLTGYAGGITNLGFPGSPQTANQLQDTMNAVKHGTKVFEVSMLQPDVGETIPEQHFDEMRALMKLTGIKPSVHAPVIDSVGFGEQGWGKEQGRADNERRMFNAIEKAQMLDPSGNLPIVFHATNGTPGVQYRPWNKDADREEEKDEFGRVMESGTIVNMRTGQMTPVKREEKWRTHSFNGEKKSQLFEVKDNVGAMNRGEWENKLTEVAQMNKHAEEIMGGARMMIADYEGAHISPDGKFLRQTEKEGVYDNLPAIDPNSGRAEALNKLQKAGLFLNNAELSFEGAFDIAYEYGTEQQKERLEALARDYNAKKPFGSETHHLKNINGESVNIFSSVNRQTNLDEAIKELSDITQDKIVVKNGRPMRSEGWGAPKICKLSEDLALDKASETFGNLAIKSYDKFKEKAPVIAIENAYPSQALCDANSLKGLVEKSRERLVKHLVGKGMKEDKAQTFAAEKVGVTFDVGHVNIVKGKGFGDDEILRQTKVLTEDKTMVKHVHLTDNFGYADSHLVPGMGNVPIKSIMEELEKTGRLDEMRKIAECGGIVQHFKKVPHSMTLASMGSPIYGMKNAPTWGQAMDFSGSYFGGYGTVNPATHHQYFGSGFTTMPVELGGQMAGAGQQSRFGGTPMA